MLDYEGLTGSGAGLDYGVGLAPNLVQNHRPPIDQLPHNASSPAENDADQVKAPLDNLAHRSGRRGSVGARIADRSEIGPAVSEIVIADIFDCLADHAGLRGLCSTGLLENSLHRFDRQKVMVRAGEKILRKGAQITARLFPGRNPQPPDQL